MKVEKLVESKGVIESGSRGESFVCSAPCTHDIVWLTATAFDRAGQNLETLTIQKVDIKIPEV